MRRALILSITVIGLSMPVFAQEPEPRLPQRLGGSNGPTKADEALAGRPVPKLADGTVDLSGVWTGGGNEPVGELLKPGELNGLLTPAGRKVLASRTANPGDDPYFACMPGGPLRITGGFAWRLVQHPTVNATHIFMLQEGNAHSYRQIFMNAKHPEDPTPTWYGHSVGRWEGDTLVVDVTNVSDKNNYRGSREGLHLVERFTRAGDTLRYQVTVDDPTTWTRPWTAALDLAVQAEGMFEYGCHEGNHAMRNILSGARAAEAGRR